VKISVTSLGRTKRTREGGCSKPVTKAMKPTRKGSFMFHKPVMHL